VFEFEEEEEEEEEEEKHDMITVDRSGLVKKNNSGATSAEKKKEQKEKEKEKNHPQNTKSQQTHGYLAQHDFSSQTCLACSLRSSQDSQKRFFFFSSLTSSHFEFLVSWFLLNFDPPTHP